jgi:DNA repair exonuclease SbcCD ATPase subunit
LEPLIWQDICRFLARPEIVLEHFERQSDEQQAAIARQDEQERALRRRRAVLAQEIERWLDAYPKALSSATEGVTADDVDRKVAELRSQLKKLERQLTRLAAWSERLAARRARRADLQELLVRLAERLRSAGEAERAAIVQELVVRVEVEAERDACGTPIFHYERRHRADGSFRYAQRIPHVIVHVVYAFPEQDFPANEEAEDTAHEQACALLLAQSHSLTDLN